MPVLLVLVAIAVIAVVAAVTVGRVRGGLDDPRPARPDNELPAGRLAVADVAGVRFAVGLRGYRMDEVDDFVDRMLQELRATQQDNAQLAAQLSDQQTMQPPEQQTEQQNSELSERVELSKDTP